MHFPGNLSILQIIRKILQSMSFPESSYRFFPDFAHTPEIARAVSPHFGCQFGSRRTARLRPARFDKTAYLAADRQFQKWNRKSRRAEIRISHPQLDHRNSHLRTRT
jgi:hypothetical protein